MPSGTSVEEANSKFLTHLSVQVRDKLSKNKHLLVRTISSVWPWSIWGIGSPWPAIIAQGYISGRSLVPGVKQRQWTKEERRYQCYVCIRCWLGSKRSRRERALSHRMIGKWAQGQTFIGICPGQSWCTCVVPAELVMVSPLTLNSVQFEWQLYGIRYKGNDGDDCDVHRISLFLKLFDTHSNCLFCLEEEKNTYMESMMYLNQFIGRHCNTSLLK